MHRPPILLPVASLIANVLLVRLSLVSESFPLDDVLGLMTPEVTHGDSWKRHARCHTLRALIAQSPVSKEAVRSLRLLQAIFGYGALLLESQSQLVSSAVLAALPASSSPSRTISSGRRFRNDPRECKTDKNDDPLATEDRSPQRRRLLQMPFVTSPARQAIKDIACRTTMQ